MKLERLLRQTAIDVFLVSLNPVCALLPMVLEGGTAQIKTSNRQIKRITRRRSHWPLHRLMDSRL